MSKLLDRSAELIIAIENTLEARLLHIEMQSQHKKFGAEPPKINIKFNKGVPPPDPLEITPGNKSVALIGLIGRYSNLS